MGNTGYYPRWSPRNGPLTRPIVTKTMVQNMLETCLAEVISEIAELLSTKKRLEERNGKVQAKIGVNSNRMQVGVALRMAAVVGPARAVCMVTPWQAP